MHIRLESSCLGGDYVEFNSTGSEKHYEHWEETSLFLKDFIFSVFADYFENSVDEFHYYGPTLYAGADLQQLSVQLQTALDDLNKVSGPESLTSFICQCDVGVNFLTELQSEGIDPKANWVGIRKDLAIIVSTLLEMIQRVIETERVLWVLGV